MMAAAEPETHLDDDDYQSHPEDDSQQDPDDDELVNLEARKEWDEGGPSDCGYNDSVHGVLMSVGNKVHGVVGEPPEGVHGVMNVIGNWFQEASYAVRDFARGEDSEGMKEDTHQAMKDLFTGGEKDGEKGETKGEEKKDES